MRVPELKNYIVDLYAKETKRLADSPGDRRSALMITGPPGIGKSVAAYEAAVEIAKDTRREFLYYYETAFFDLWSDRLTQKAKDVMANPDKYFIYKVEPLNLSEPTDLVGKPKELPELAVMRYLPHFFVKLLHLCPGFFVLEDFLDTQRDDVLSAGYRVALDKELGYIPLNKDMMVAATSNTPEFSSLSRAMPAPLANRWEDHSVDSPTVDEWNAWMAARYADRWDKRCYVFNKRFESDGYFLKVPDEPETTKNFPTPRTWTQLARNTYYSCSSPDALLGPEVGQKFRAFCDINVDIEELIADPAPWGKLDLDAKYMAGAMLASWFGKTPKEKLHESFNLIDTISDDSREYLVLVFQCTKVSALSRLFSQLFPYAKKYEKIAKQTLKDRTEVLT